MNKPYQIHKQKAVQRFRRLAEEKNEPVQVVLPMKEVVATVQEGISNLLKQVGVQIMQQVMEQEVAELVERSPSSGKRQRYRWGTEKGYCVLVGQKVKVCRPRVRDVRNHEVPLGSYELFQRGSLVGDAVWRRLMHGLTTRKYSQVVQEFTEAYGIKKSTVSDQFVAASREKLQQLLTRPLSGIGLCAIVIDGTYIAGQDVIVAIGIDNEGHKTVLGLRQGASENATVVKELLCELQERGLDFEIPRLYVIDGSKALMKAVRQMAGAAAFIQRCQIHKIRNVADHLTEEYRGCVQHKMRAAYAMTEYSDARRALDALHRELMHLNESAARSLGDGLEESLTVHRLRLPGVLRRSLASTNVIESSFSVVETICRRVKRWHNGDQRLRWTASAMLYAESRWNRVRGYRQIPILLKELEVAIARKHVPQLQAGAAA